MISTEQRDNDIHTLAKVDSALSQFPKLCFLITGSYAIEALTHAPLDHGDMDINILAPDLPEARTIALASLGSIHSLQPYKLASDRLEYDIPAKKAEISRRIEIHLIKATPDPDAQVPTYILESRGPNKTLVQIAGAWLRDSSEKDFLFKTKSLAYTIATWALRISGAAQNQLRAVRESDLRLFNLLMEQDFNPNEVYSAIEHHPQASENPNPDRILQAARNELNRLKY